MNKKSIFLLILVLNIFSYQAEGQNVKQVDSLLKYKPVIQKTVTPYQNSFSFSALYTSNYIWRDIITNYAALQPSATYSFGNTGFSVNFWSSYGVDKRSNDLEISTTFSYSVSPIKGVNTSVGYVRYLAPILTDGTNFFFDTNFEEYFFGLSIPKLSQGNLYVYIKNNGGIYSKLSFSKSFSVINQLNLNLFSSLGYRMNDSVDPNGFRDLNLTVTLPLQLKYVTFGVMSSVTHIVRDKVTTYQVGINFTFKQ